MMIVRNTLKAAALASVCLAPLAAAAQDDTGMDMGGPAPAQQAMPGADLAQQVFDNEFTIGVRGESSQNADFARYNGQYNYADIIGGLRLHSARDWRGNNTGYLDFDANNLSFGPANHFDLAPDASVKLRAGQQGTWGVNVGWDSNTYIQSNDFTSIYNKNGTLVPGTPATNAGADAPFAQDNVVGLRRDRGTLGINYIYGNWTVTGGLVHEHKEGTLGWTGLENSGNNSGFAAFPEPIDYDMDRFDLSAAYNTARSQTQLKYTFSNFQDNNTAFNYSPYQFKVNGGAVPGNNVNNISYGNTGYYTQAPNNMAHTFNVASAYNVNDVTRLNANLQYGLQMQDQNFSPATGSPLSPVDLTKLGGNPSSLDGMVNTAFANLAMTTKVDKVDLKASYTLDGRYSMTGGQWIYGDVGDNLASSRGGNPAGSALSYRYAADPSWTKQKVNLEAGYKVLPSTRVTVGYLYEQDDRTEAITSNLQENKAYVKARTTFTPDLIGNLDYTYANRTANAPNYNLWTSFIASDCYRSPNIGCVNIPFYEAGGTENTISGRLTDTLGQDTTLSMVGKFDSNYFDQYSGTGTLNPGVGVTHSSNLLAGPDLTYRLAPGADTDLFYTYQRTYQSMDAPNNGSEQTTGNTHTAGVNANWRASDRLKIGGGYMFSYGSEAFTQGGFDFAASPSLPMVQSMDNSVNLHADYDVAPGITWHVGYGFDRMIMNDWALWGPNPVATNGQPQLSTGEGNPSYAVHTVMTSVSFKW